MGVHYKDLTGQRFGRLLVHEIYERDKSGLIVWECQCDCGNIAFVKGTYLIHGATTSCGCYQKESARKRRIKSNTYDLSGSYGIGYTLKGEPFYFDLEDYELIKDYCWHRRSDGYIDAKIRDGSGKRILMHVLIMGQKHIDHIGGTETVNDNRKENLRIPPDDLSFDSYNQMNKQIQSNNKSGCPGVIWHKRDQIWEVYISVNKRRIYLGRYEDYDDAVSARKAAEQEYFGNYSYDNSQMTFYF